MKIFIIKFKTPDMSREVMTFKNLEKNYNTCLSLSKILFCEHTLQ